MSIEIEISPVFGQYTDNHRNIEVEGKTVAECIDDLVRQYPAMKKVILDKDGKLGYTYYVYVNGASANRADMDKPVRDGDKINIMMLIQGG